MCPSRTFLIHNKEGSPGTGRRTGQSWLCHHRAAMTDVHWECGLHPPMPWFEDATAPLWLCTRSSGEAWDRGARCQSGTADANDLPHRKRIQGESNLSDLALEVRCHRGLNRDKVFHDCHPHRRRWPTHTCSSSQQTTRLEKWT